MMFEAGSGPEVQPVTSIGPLRWRTSVASPRLNGAYACPPMAKPPPESAGLKPLLKLATSFERSSSGTSIGPSEAIATFGSSRPG